MADDKNKTVKPVEVKKTEKWVMIKNINHGEAGKSYKLKAGDECPKNLLKLFKKNGLVKPIYV